MKLAITGSHGTGKTTLANALCKHIKMPLINETARAIIGTIPEGVDYRDELDTEQRFLMQKAILHLQKFHESLSK